MSAANFTCAGCGKSQLYSHHPAFLRADDITLLCDECGTCSGEPITVQWKQVREPTNLRCTKCETELRYDSAADVLPWACAEHEIRLCSECGPKLAVKHHHIDFHERGKMEIKMYRIQTTKRMEPPNFPMTESQVLRDCDSSSGVDSMPSALEARGFYLYLPPSRIGTRFIMLEESSKTFYEVDAQTPRLGNPTSWEESGFSSTNFGRDLAIVIPNTLDPAYKSRIASREFPQEFGVGKTKTLNPQFEVGTLVAISRSEGNTIYGEVLGRVNINPSEYITWSAMQNMKGSVLSDEMRNGLLGSLWGNRHVDRKVMHLDILAEMPRKWHEDPVVLSNELDNMFASGHAIPQGEVFWVVAGL